MSKLILVLFFVCSCCASTNPDPAVLPDAEARPLAIGLNPEQACKYLIGSLERSTRAAQAIASQRSGAESLKIEIVGTQCQGHAMIADVLFSAIGPDGKRIAVIVTSGFRLNPDGTITGQEIGMREAD